MKKRDIVNLIRYHVEHNDDAFISQAMDIASEFKNMGDNELSDYVISMVSTSNVLVPQTASANDNLNFLEEINLQHNSYFVLPNKLNEQIKGIINAVSHVNNLGVNKFLFEGKPGTGKTEVAKIIADILNRKLMSFNMSELVDSKLGQTVKNIDEAFQEINSYSMPDRIIVLMDEIDSIALDRIDNNDIREMGRATTAVLRGLDGLSDDVILIATTNLYKHFDKALSRRFSLIVDFNDYSRQDLIDASVALLKDNLSKNPNLSKDIRIFKKIIKLYKEIPLPGDMQNIIKTSIAFSSPDSKDDYLIKLYKTVTNKNPNAELLKKQKFTLRESAVLLNTSTATVSRQLRKDIND